MTKGTKKTRRTSATWRKEYRLTKEAREQLRADIIEFIKNEYSCYQRGLYSREPELNAGWIAYSLSEWTYCPKGAINWNQTVRNQCEALRKQGKISSSLGCTKSLGEVRMYEPAGFSD